jgi:antitoxin (DNA-binding transcriptional repressor) of toxin-antitoxin stability system
MAREIGIRELRGLNAADFDAMNSDGEDVIITDRNRAVMKLVPLDRTDEQPSKLRRFLHRIERDEPMETPLMATILASRDASVETDDES